MLLKQHTIVETFMLWSPSSKINEETIRPHPLKNCNYRRY